MSSNKQGNTTMALSAKSEPENAYLSEAEYLVTEPDSEVRREYINGQLYAMAGGSANHNILSGNIFGEFRNHLKGTPCVTFMSDIKVPLKVSSGNNYVYPDVLVDCSKIEGKSYFSNSPLLIVEVLSKSTRKRDLTTKLLRYINLPSLLEYVVVEQDFVQIHVFRKKTDWKDEFYFLGDSITFESIALTLSVADIYDRVENEDMDEFRQGIVVFDQSENDG
ncbi:Uma2 family endonuclease [Crenothrix sp.]|uniref:Uma2 family endonuclease n=1 Tax=Crenothrix sp. TaxID=3100433 RepID=UPI00374D7A2D